MIALDSLNLNEIPVPPVRPVIGDRQQALLLATLVRCVSHVYGIPESDLLRKGSRMMSEPKSVAAYFCRKIVGAPLTDIARALSLSESSPTSINERINEVSARIARDPEFSEQMSALKAYCEHFTSKMAEPGLKLPETPLSLDEAAATISWRRHTGVMIDHLAAQLQVSSDDLRSHDPLTLGVRRQAASVLRSVTDMSGAVLCRILGWQEPSAVYLAVAMTRERCDEDPSYRKQFEALCNSTRRVALEAEALNPMPRHRLQNSRIRLQHVRSALNCISPMTPRVQSGLHFG